MNQKTLLIGAGVVALFLLLRAKSTQAQTVVIPGGGVAAQGIAGDVGLGIGLATGIAGAFKSNSVPQTTFSVPAPGPAGTSTDSLGSDFFDQLTF